jgi:hypothetical protein
MHLFRKYGIMMMIIMAALIYACGGDGSDIGEITPEYNDYHSDFFTGNEDFSKEEAQQSDPLNEFRIGDTGSNTLPASIDHSSKMPMVRNQGRTSSCTAWATGYYGKTYQEALEEGWHPDDNSFSPAYLYAMQCRNYDRPWSLVKAWQTLKTFGISKWDVMPFEDLGPENKDIDLEKKTYADLDIPQQVREQARIYRCGEMTQVSTTVAELKQALTKGPVVLAIYKYGSPAERPTPPEENYMRVNLDNKGAHAILCVGYDDNKFGEGAYKFINSWGSDWGEGGYSWIKYADTTALIMSAMTIKDLRNPNKPDGENNVTTRPDEPTNVAATDDAGPYVDITWDKVANAQYYRIYRTQVGDVTTHEAITVTHQPNHRDYPPPGVQFYYSVVAENELGQSRHLATDTDAKDYVDVGSSIGNELDAPTVRWESNNGEIINFAVSNIDTAATSMEVLISIAVDGPWKSMGWIKPEDFYIKLGENSEYAGRQPFVRVRVASADGYSEPSASAKVGEKINNSAEIAKFRIFITDSQEDRIFLRWMTDGGAVDYYETWRMIATQDNSSEWVKLGYSNPDVVDEQGFVYYSDPTAVPGVDYWYCVLPVYKGEYGDMHYPLGTVRVEVSQSNLKLASFQYEYGDLNSSTAFPQIEVRNDGAEDVEQYTIEISVYDIENDETTLIKKLEINDRLSSMHQHRISAVDVAIPPQFGDGRKYSWVVTVNHDDLVSEIFEDDNTKMSSDVWSVNSDSQTMSIEMDTGSALSQSSPASRTLIGSTRPFSKKKGLSETATGAGEADDENFQSSSVETDQFVLYDEPVNYQRPDSFDNNAAK